MADTVFYSEKIVEEFIKKKLCQDDKLLYKYYQDVDVQKFRSRLSKFKNIDDDISVVVQTYITDSVRDILLNIIGNLTQYLKPYGDLIISGGEAFNTYFDREDRVVTTDIDTKFSPFIRLDKSHIVSSNDPKMFGYIQVIKLLLWNKLGQVVTSINTIICRRVQKFVISSPVGKLLGITFPKNTHALNRRYTLIKKNKLKNILIDVELFAIDLKLKYYVPSEKKIKMNNIGGIIDIAFMRTNEFGYDATYTKDSGIFIRNPITKHITYNKSILYASKKFLIDDIYHMQKFNLRPTKKSKDQKRMYLFCKKVLKVKNIKSNDSLDSIYKKSIVKVKSISKNLLNRPIFNKKDLEKAMRVNPLKYVNVTTQPDKQKILKQLSFGIKGANGLDIPGYLPTYSKYRFMINTGKWVINNSPTYIHNEANYRPTEIKPKHNVTLQLPNMLYGYSQARDSWMLPRLVRKSALIPLVGLKNTLLV